MSQQIATKYIIKKNGGSKKTIEEIYQKKSQYEHILLRPDTYIGSIDLSQTEMWVCTDHIEKKEIKFVPGMYKVVDEILCNARDQAFKDKSVRNINISISKEDGVISVFNDGNGIDVVKHKEHKVYVPEMIFGQLLTSTNYDDTEKRKSGGKNGFGAKLCNIFSKGFKVETVDRKRKKLFVQVFKNNMKEKTEPEVTPYTEKSYTRITFVLDFEKFKVEGLDDDFIALIKRRAYDIASCTHKHTTVSFNGEEITVKDFKDYVNLYIDDEEVIYKEVNEDWQVAVVFKPKSEYQQVSFVNGIFTNRGGTHVDYILKKVIKGISDIIESKKKGFKVRSNYIKDHLWIFVNSTIVNPNFDSQIKGYLETKASKFGSTCDISEGFIKKFAKTGIVNEVIELASFKESRELRKNDGKKISTIKGIPNLEDANKAGGKESTKCTLIIIEGLSAKTLAMSGMAVVGSDYFGAFPIKGKLLNMRGATESQIANNAETNYLKKILGLKEGQVYDDTLSLRYGQVLILTDADVDGIHIAGLIMNMFHLRWPSLLKIKGFLRRMNTPIVKVKKGKKVESFYTNSTYLKWKSKNLKGWTIKYYKGLGTSTSKEAKEYFRDYEMNSIDYKWDDKSDEKISLAFSKVKDKDRKSSDKRKEWIGNWLENNSNTDEIEQINEDTTYTDFVDSQLIFFSNKDNVRSIPSICDGLKPSQRKILYAAFKRKLRKSVKVSQFAGSVSEITAYHHGEKSLMGGIVGMSQDFIGSNNINLLVPEGQFGSRLQGGKDSADPRYISTRLENITEILYDSRDFSLLEYLDDDGEMIEPKWYIPILPTVLINGSNGIGTGYSTKIPCYNPLDIVKNIRNKMEDKPYEVIQPWYRGFNGTVTRMTPDKFKIHGSYERTTTKSIRVTELPVFGWTNCYRERLESHLIEKANGETSTHFIKKIDKHNTDFKVHFDVEFMSKTSLDKHLEDPVKFADKMMKLTTTISTTNMYLFDKNGKIKKYDSPKEIIEEFYETRLEYYQKRKDYILAKLQRDVNLSKNKCKFITMIVEKKLDIFNKKKIVIEGILEEHKFVMFSSNMNLDDKSYNYLMEMKFWTATTEKIEELKKKMEENLQTYQDLYNRTPKELWSEDLDTFLKAYNVFLKVKEENEKDAEVINDKTKKKKRKKK
jgi:DNA topoisomerase-2